MAAASTRHIEPLVRSGQVKEFTGAAWAEKATKIWNGSIWTTKLVKQYTGSSWITLS